MQDLALAGERSSEEDEPLINQPVHESRVLIPPVLLAQIARSIPPSAALEANREEHEVDLAPSARVDSCAMNAVDVPRYEAAGLVRPIAATPA